MDMQSPYYLSSLGVKTNRDGLLSFNDPSMLNDNNAESLRSFLKIKLYQLIL